MSEFSRKFEESLAKRQKHARQQAGRNNAPPSHKTKYKRVISEKYKQFLIQKYFKVQGYVQRGEMKKKKKKSSAGGQSKSRLAKSSKRSSTRPGRISNPLQVQRRAAEERTGSGFLGEQGDECTQSERAGHVCNGYSVNDDRFAFEVEEGVGGVDVSMDMQAPLWQVEDALSQKERGTQKREIGR